MIFKKVLKLDPRNIEALLHIGYIYRSIKENVKAFKCFKQILSIEPDNFLAYFGLGRLYQSLDNHDNEAIKCFKNCLNINSESLKANLQLGIIYLKTKNYEESLKCLQTVIKLEPNNVLGLVALGNVYLEINAGGIKNGAKEANGKFEYLYPRTEFWSLVSHTKAKVIIGVDAHNPLDFGGQAVLKAKEFASKFNLDMHDFIEF